MEFLIASDHRGFSLKERLAQFLNDEGHVVQDLGPYDLTSADYPDYAHLLAKKLRDEQVGVLICGSGIGMSIAANRHRNIRAALCRSIKDIYLSRKHNNANVLVLGSDETDYDHAKEMVDEFIKSSFDKGRHETRVNKINI
ncbi:MAG: ribose 5-phosphate isomerase B [Rickettsiales bacterium]